MLNVNKHLTRLSIFCQDAGAGLLAAAMIAVVPGYISRSVAGSYDNEGTSARHFVPFLLPLLENVPRSSLFVILILSCCLRRHRHLLHAADLLHVDQGCEDRLHLLVLCLCPGLLLHGELGLRGDCGTVATNPVPADRTACWFLLQP